MPNSNYRRGRAREYQVLHMLRSSGWVCSRSAMSHGPIDVFAARSGNVLLIQVKSGSARVKKQELVLLKSWAEEFNASAEVWYFRNRRKIRKVSVYKRKTRNTERPTFATLPPS
ncbi:MAG: hypothetical protein ACREBQ_04840 [Nitrososphaerales archaeon]